MNRFHLHMMNKWKNERSIDLLLGQKTKSIMHTYTSTSQFFLPHPLSKKREKLNCSYGSRQLNVRQIQSEWRISTTLAQYVQSRNMNKFKLAWIIYQLLKTSPQTLGSGHWQLYALSIPWFWMGAQQQSQANLLTFPETSMWPITFCKFGKYNVPLSLVPKRSCTLHKRKEHTKAARTTQVINNRNLIESFENIPVPPQPVSFSLGLSSGAFSARCRDWDSKFTLSECYRI